MTDKVKILFVCASMKVGGAEKSLVNLLNLIDYNKYDVDLLLFQKQGVFLTQIPKMVTLLDMKPHAKILYDKVPFSFCKLCLQTIKYVSTAVEKILWKEYDALRAHRWYDIYRYICEPLDTSYDVAVGYMSGEPTYFVLDKVKATRYVTFFHTDISNILLDTKIEKRYLQKADLIVTISNRCVESINYVFPEFVDKTVCLENLNSPQLIQSLAGNAAPIEYENYANSSIIVSVGRLIHLKGYDMAVDAAAILKEKHFSFQWFIIGEGDERDALSAQIHERGLDNCFHLLGLRANPYPYIKYANILVQSSRYEGKSVVLDEAKILNKNIVVTNYSSVTDQIEHGKNGMIAEMTAESIAEQIEKYLHSENILTDFSTTKPADDANTYMECLTGKRMR